MPVLRGGINILMEQEASAELVFYVTGITREEQIYLYTVSVLVQRSIF